MEQRERLSSTLIAVAEGDEPSISFIPDGMIESASCNRIIRSVITIGEEVGLPFDILVPAFKGKRGSVGISEESYDERIFIYPVSESDNALGFLTELSDSKYICLFSSRTPTDADMADVISRYIRSGDRRLLVSDVSILPRSELLHAGGLKNLGKYSIVDLYGRMAAIRGVISCPTARRSMNFFSPVLGESIFSGDMDGMAALRIEDYLRIKMSAGLGSADLVILVKHSVLRRRLSAYIRAFMTLPFRRKDDARIGRAGYVRFMESLVESIIFEDFRDFLPDREIMLRIGGPELAVLRRNSTIWRTPIEAIRRYVTVDTGQNI